MSGERQSQYVHHGQQQAKAAWGWVADAAKEEKSKKFKDRYATLARKLPSYLQVSGLGQTMAFLYANKDKESGAEGALYNQLGKYLSDRLRPPQTDAMEMIIHFSPQDYRRATRELMQVADWLKRFAEGKLEGKLGTGRDT